MDVFVIPVSVNRYELYCEQGIEFEPEVDVPPSGVAARLQRRFDEVLRDVEAHEEGEGPPLDERAGLTDRLKDRLLSWIAERIAEQRLLWNLRKQTDVLAVHPMSLPFDDVLAHIRSGLRRDYERHRFWLVVDAIGLLLAGVLAPIPGPNLLAYYFLFRVGGHFLSMRGAHQGLHRVTWTGQPCQPLDQLRGVWLLDTPARQQRILDVATELRLRRLPKFFERVVRAKTARRPKTE
jgi:hypothetical protein